MFSITDDQAPADPDFESLISESPPKASLTSESVLNRGAWQGRLAARTVGDGAARAEALEWHPEVTLRKRIMKAVSVPAFAGAAVFVVAVIIAIIMTMLQSGAAIDTPAALAVSEGEQRTGNPAQSHGPSRDGGDDGAPSEGTNNAQTPNDKIFVHIVGEVANPGVVELTAGTRVAEAIKAAGGATSLASLEAVNLARSVTDGEQLLVPNAEQAAAGLSASQPLEISGSVGESHGSVSPLVNINTADAALLETLPRIGPALAQRILDWRQANGSFTSVDELMEVSGVGTKTFEGLRERVTV
ncbi:ComEA family DNA-binding protein [Leucobacter coleopterorum]|uniref:ComEA family DNA-binding protein n=1 Tax=Leucobacter coleopterorum TaxID=2714933 RepID=A0ABX6JX71_9MICO|nr:ComEA family DNA-binding protein [Leucobacter coleopterorum]QIM18556.1 ComEA family DNA-binding protein [Leucobacter coleopterorum]